MRTAIVIGTIVATRKEEGLVGSKLLLTQPVNIDKEPVGEPFIAVDTVGAGIGEFVMYSTGTASRNAANKPKSSIDAAIVGIIDGVDIRTDLFDHKK
ncbi:EutN/CcmL family microcompartment protein [Acidaminobacter sp.]|uniref:EutN/CcmL family microcompartment protein n=1 Tax=Acidaminobacter sp. TaxID=1872102 RepID=UPI001384F805|nr:EutN/CcmL family microcompartment protein [Acidaminobacter sp.]MDK9712191.1 EutN/CcmL family microcompartment protein [Acidaminobacter sp.]MZQ97700.1 ethanolamine utilization protein EutN [Acidaminobacter sp.]